MQSLPNDDPIDPKMAALTPPLLRKNSTSRNTQHSDNIPKTRRMNSHDRSPVPGDLDYLETLGSSNSYGQQDYFVGQNSTPGQRFSGDINSYGANSSHATIPVSGSVRASQHGGYSSGQQSKSRTPSINEFDTRHLEKDINFQYLKHVVMKFMLSREHEVCEILSFIHFAFFHSLTWLTGIFLRYTCLHHSATIHFA